MTVRGLVHPLPAVRRISLLRQRLSFKGFASFWERSYARGDTIGSYGATADTKAEFLNTFVRDHGLRSVVEFGCGDGYQLSLADYPSYVGLDVSQTAIGVCQKRFAGDPSKSFFLYDGTCFVDRASLFAADLAISLDVICYLIEDAVFDAYMAHLFAAGQLFVVVYATNNAKSGTTPHVLHRCFTSWVQDNCPQWKLTSITPGPNSGPDRADFFIYEKASRSPCL